MMPLVLFGTFFVFLLLGAPIAVSLGVSSLIAMVIQGYGMEIIASVVYSSLAKYTLLAVPFFILAGYIMEKADISGRLVHLAEVMMGKSRYNLAIIAVVVCCFFAAISGSGPATVAAVGSVLIPEMKKRGYGQDFPGALLSASGSIGIIIPPSIPFVIYASIAEISVTKMFLAGIVPGVLVGVGYIITSYFMLRNEPNLKPAERTYTAEEKWSAFKDAAWGLMTPVIILGGIYGGIFTPTEAAGIAIVYGLFVGLFIYKTISIKGLFSMFADAIAQTSTVMFVVAAAGIFGWVLTTSLVAREFSSFVLTLTTNKFLILFMMNIIFLIAGCFLDTVSALYILVPIMLPIVKSLGVDLFHFGVFMTANFAVGQFTPPVGPNLYVACNISKRSLKELITKVAPFVVAGFITTLILTYIPQISAFLPDLFKV